MSYIQPIIAADIGLPRCEPPGDMVHTALQDLCRPSDTVRIRPLTPRDEPAAQRFLEGLTPADLCRRFACRNVPRPGDVMRYLFGFGADWIEAFGAFDGAGRLLGCGSLGRDGKGRAELGVIVQPDHQSRGIGVALIAAMERSAIASGDSSLICSVLSDNPRSVSLFKRQGFTVTERCGTELYLAKSLVH